MINPDLPRRIKLAGVSFDVGEHNTQQNIEVLTIGDFEPAELVLEPENPYDRNAIRVVWKEEFHLGYIPKAYNSYLSPLISSGRHFQACNFKRNQHPHHKTMGVSVEIKEVTV